MEKVVSCFLCDFVFFVCFLILVGFIPRNYLSVSQIISIVTIYF